MKKHKTFDLLDTKEIRIINNIFSKFLFESQFYYFILDEQVPNLKSP